MFERSFVTNTRTQRLRGEPGCDTALAGLKAAFSCLQTHLSSNVYLLLVNQEAALQLQGTLVCSSQSTFLEFQRVAQRWPSRPNRLLALPQGRVHVHWIPRHPGIAGNEAADRQANLGATTPGHTSALPLPGWHGLGGPSRVT